MKKGDIFLILIISLIAIGSYLVYRFTLPTFDEAYVQIKVDGEVIMEIKMDESVYEEIIIDEFGWNRIIVDGDAVYVEDADCPDRECIKLGEATPLKPKTIICAPNRLVVKIVGSAVTDGPDDIVT